MAKKATKKTTVKGSAKPLSKPSTTTMEKSTKPASKPSTGGGKKP